MLTDEDVATIKDSWRNAEPMATALPELLFRRLFEQRPDLRSLFRSEQKAHEARFLDLVRRVIRGLPTSDLHPDPHAEPADDDDVFLLLLALGRRHAELYEVPSHGWAVFQDAWLGAMRELMGPAFTPPVRTAWTKLLDVVQTTMKLGAGSQVELQMGRAQ